MSNEKVEVLSEDEMNFIQSLFQNLFPSTRDLFVFHEMDSKEIHIDICGMVGNHNTILYTMGMSLHHYDNISYEIFTIVPNNWFKVDPGDNCFFEKPKSEVFSNSLSITVNFLIQFARNKISNNINNSLYEDGIVLANIEGLDNPLSCFIVDNYKTILKDKSELHLLFLKLTPKIDKDIKYVDELNREFINNLISYIIEK